MNTNWSADAIVKPPVFRHFWKVVATILVFSVFIKIPTLSLPHGEGDEVALWHLATNWANTGNYTDRGPDMADNPVYIDRFARAMPTHPPVFAALMLPFAKAQAIDKAVIASWIGHFLAILAVALIGRHLFRDSHEVRTAFSPYFVIPVLGMALDPVMTWISGVIWIDNLDAGFAALAIAMAMTAAQSKRAELVWTGAGIALGLGLLSKVTAGIVLPVLAYLLYVTTPPTNRVKAFIYTGLPAVILAAPWYISLYWNMGEFVFPSWQLPHGVAPAAPCPFCEISATRPFYYFFLKIALISPLAVLFLIVLATMLIKWRQGLTKEQCLSLTIPVVWFTVIMVAATIVGSFIMRRVSIALPAIYVMALFAFRAMEHEQWSRWREPVLFLTLLSVTYSSATAGIYLFRGGLAEFFSPLELAGIINLWAPR